jgi:hypothetical protein
VLIINAFLNLKFAMVSMIARITRRLMKTIPFVQITEPVREIILNVKELIFVSNPIGSAVSFNVQML